MVFTLFLTKIIKKKENDGNKANLKKILSTQQKNQILSVHNILQNIHFSFFNVLLT